MSKQAVSRWRREDDGGLLRARMLSTLPEAVSSVPLLKVANYSVTSTSNKPSAKQARVVKSDYDAMATIKEMMATIDLKLRKLQKLDIIETHLTAMDRAYYF